MPVYHEESNLPLFELVYHDDLYHDEIKKQSNMIHDVVCVCVCVCVCVSTMMKLKAVNILVSTF